MKLTVEQRLQVQEDIFEISQLKANYCQAADLGWERRGHDAAGISALFVEEGIWDAGSFGRGEGREAIRRLMETDASSFGLHIAMNPVIKVNGDAATGRWHFLCPAVIGDESVWIGGIYNDEFVRTGEGWRFKSLRVTIVFTTKQQPGFDINAAFGG